MLRVLRPQVYELGGEDLAEEMEGMDKIRSGEARMCKAWHMPAQSARRDHERARPGGWRCVCVRFVADIGQEGLR